MKTEKKKTFIQGKETFGVSEEALAKSKNFREVKKKLVQILKEGPKTIPEITEDMEMPTSEVLYYLMTLRKYGEIIAGELDDMDEYYYYQLKEN